MLTTEKAFDCLPYVADIFEKLNLQNELDKMREEVMKTKGKKEERQRKMGMAFIMHIVRNSPQCKESFFPLMSVIMDCTVEEAKLKPVGETVGALKQLFADEDLMGFFNSAVQEGQKSL